MLNVARSHYYRHRTPLEVCKVVGLQCVCMQMSAASPCTWAIQRYRKIVDVVSGTGLAVIYLSSSIFQNDESLQITPTLTANFSSRRAISCIASMLSKPSTLSGVSCKKTHKIKYKSEGHRPMKEH